MSTVSFSRLGVHGRLGNQLFQLAATISLAATHGARYLFPPWEYAPHFSLPTESFDSACRDGVARNVYKEPWHRLGCYDAIPYDGGDLDLVGYFQSERYFLEHQALLRKLFAFRRPAERKPGACSVHVRRCDYRHIPDMMMGMDYFIEAMRRVSCQRFIVFSDDIPWCREHFTDGDVTFALGTPEQDLAEMAACEHHIIANSSFSWWGAWLDPNPNKTVVAPNTLQWIAGREHSLDDLIPSSWIQL